MKIKNVIKRNGTVESFDPKKINHWASWACKDIDNVSWSEIVLDAISKCSSETVSTTELQANLIDSCLSRNTWNYNLIAGKLYIADRRKTIFPNGIPTIKELHTKLRELDLMIDLGYSDEEYEILEKLIDHDRDMSYACFQIKHIIRKYSIADKVNGVHYETPQFIFMRMAMALGSSESEDKLTHIKNWYDHFSFNRINAPTPNYINLGTKHNSFASCCLYSVDDNVKSLACGDHIAYTMTYMSAGIGSVLHTRSIGDPIRNGMIVHQGKLPYYKSLAGAIHANLQGGRGGACTTYYTVFDPEVLTITNLQNPRATDSKKNRDIMFCAMYNRFFAKMVIDNKDIFTFNIYTAPDLYNAFFSKNEQLFEHLYMKYLEDNSFEKQFISSRYVISEILKQSIETGTLYLLNITECNLHTPFKDTIYSSNLCLEITVPTKPYNHILDIYSKDHYEGEIGLCNLAAIVVPNIKSDEEYESACYYALKMIDKCIHMSRYELPHLEYTAKSRLNAAVGMIGLATVYARESCRFDSKEGLRLAHDLAERHAYYCISASLRLGQELGNAPWIDKTKWSEGWLPIDSYNKNVDELVEPIYKFNWEDLRERIIKNGGIRNSSLIAHMPTESSSKASGTPNSVYPIRNLYIKKTDLNIVVDWTAIESDELGARYQLAWDIDGKNLAKYYSVLQKFCDQSISADFYIDRNKYPDIPVSMLLEEWLTKVKYGLKSRYYYNSLTSIIDNNIGNGKNCNSESCTL